MAGEVAVIEVRDYHYDPSRLPEYRAWAAEAGPWLRKRWDVDGFWVHGEEEGELFGAEPVPSPHGPRTSRG